ncbi:MAG TPA: hypothetical protein VH275_02380 [Solirubrobacterales bacterium]|jgi:hypothetical protein|nr:hypothetical protein [Solirubrobacterales bacterium]
MRSRRSVIAAIVIALCVAIPAQAEVSQQGNLITSFESDLAPKKLPRKVLAPVAVRVAGDFKTTKGAQLPQLRTISVAINRAGRLYDKGLPTCRLATIEPATEEAAQRLCHRAIVGSGHVTVGVHLENQAVFEVKANLLAFNGPREHGHKLILAQVYTKDPPGAFVLTFKLKRGPGLFGTVMSTSLPASAQGWAYLSHFDMTLDRQYRYRGKAHSYVSAACSAPAGFPGAVFPLAKASYGFANGQTLKTTVVRSCRVSGG